MKKSIFFAGVLLCAQPARPVQFSAADLVAKAVFSGLSFGTGMMFVAKGLRQAQFCVFDNKSNYLGMAESPYSLIDRSNIVVGFGLMFIGALMTALTVKDAVKLDEEIDELAETVSEKEVENLTP